MTAVRDRFTHHRGLFYGFAVSKWGLSRTAIAAPNRSGAGSAARQDQTPGSMARQAHLGGPDGLSGRCDRVRGRLGALGHIWPSQRSAGSFSALRASDSLTPLFFRAVDAACIGQRCSPYAGGRCGPWWTATLSFRLDLRRRSATGLSQI